MIAHGQINEFLSSHAYQVNTRRCYRGILTRFLRDVDPDALRWRQRSVAWVEKLPVTPSSKQFYVDALKSFFKWCVKRGYCEMNPVDTVRIRVYKTNLRHAFTLDEVRTLLEVALVEGDEKGFRDYAIMVFMLHTALRIGGLVSIDLEDISEAEGKTVAKYQGKGHVGKDSFVVVPQPAFEAIEQYLSNCEPQRPIYNGTGPLFLTVAHNRQKRLSISGVRWMIRERLAQAGVTRKGVCVHSFRHTAATTAYRSGADILSIQKMLDHASLQTTQIYLHSIDRIQGAAELKIDYGLGPKKKKRKE